MFRPGLSVLLLGCVACGARTPLRDEVDSSARATVMPAPEVCNGLDDDLSGDVDEDFRDELGLYVHEEHCGGCNRPCLEAEAPALEVACVVLDGTPACAALACEPGFVPSATGVCVPAFDRICLPCTEDGICGDAPSAACTEVGGELRCTVGCELGCPAGYACSAEGQCTPTGGSCRCGPDDAFTLACALEDPEGNVCPGRAECDNGALSACEAPEDVCDEVDNDCDGSIDEGFRDARGAYILDPRNCGECGVDCTESTIPEGDLTCGGDPFAPECVLHCPDSDDGIQPGDRIDADRNIATGCECTVTSLTDEPGPVLAMGAELDVNCDGADGVVVESFYVATDGDDGDPGSPTRPLESIQAALDRAAESLGTDAPRPHVFVAAGDYTETLTVPDGVELHGGYRRDYLALDPDGFRVQVRAPSDTDALGGAALVVDGAGQRPTVVEWLSVSGVDAREASSPAFGAVLTNPGPALTLRDMTVHAGVGGSGAPGMHGDAGSDPVEPAGTGSPPGAAEEDARHVCLSGDVNAVRGGSGGRNTCGGVQTHGGGGGTSRCPRFANRQEAGARGQSAGAGTDGGAGGQGGQDSRGPIMGLSCSEAVCCGLADFSVPSQFSGPEPGQPGRDGRVGSAGTSCDEPLGRIVADEWRPGGEATAGTDGTPGSGAGGGGAGGGAEMDWFDGQCEFPDGLGGGGGGGGAGGCGGSAGTPGTSGGPSVALVVRYTEDRERAPTFRGVTFVPRDGGRGGDGGAGGDGGLGGLGGFGGSVPPEQQSTPTLAGPFPGGRGGTGGDGGSGGGAGGGCGGSAVGIWVTGNAPPGVDGWRGTNDFVSGRPGQGGRGGGGGAPAPQGAQGVAIDVVVQ